MSKENSVRQGYNFLKKWDQNSKLNENQLDLLEELEESTKFLRISPYQGTSMIAESTQPNEVNLPTLNELLKWSYNLEEEELKQKQLWYFKRLEWVKKQKERTNEISNKIEHATDKLVLLEKHHLSVSEKTGKLRDLCENLLGEQNRLASFVESIDNKIKYFQVYKELSQMINSLSFSVENKQFSQILKQLDESIQYIEKNPSFVDSQMYLVKFEQLQTRALVFIKNHFSKVIKTTTSQVANYIKNLGQLSETSITKPSEVSVFYVRFSTIAPKLKQYISQIEIRNNRKDSQLLLKDCKSIYVQSRINLLYLPVKTHLETIIETKDDIHYLARAGCAYIIGLCDQEYQLFYEFFSLGTNNFSTESTQSQVSILSRKNSANKVNDSLFEISETLKVDELLQFLGNILYAFLRSRIIKLKSIDSLRKLILIFTGNQINEELRNSGESVQGLIPVLSRMIKDTQERLIFQAQLYIRDRIADFSPQSQHLKYPEMLVEYMKKRENLENVSISDEKSQELNDESESFKSQPSNQEKKMSEGNTPKREINRNSNKTVKKKIFQNRQRRTPRKRQDMGDISSTLDESKAKRHIITKEEITTWYPTLKRTITILSKIYGIVAPLVFEELAQESISICVHSFVHASNMIESKNDIDKQLFLLRHLLLLREQIKNFGDVSSVKESALDFSQIKNSLKTFVSQKFPISLFSLSSKNPLFNIAQNVTPKLIEIYFDPKQELENEVKSSATLFINQAIDSVIKTLKDNFIWLCGENTIENHLIRKNKNVLNLEKKDEGEGESEGESVGEGEDNNGKGKKEENNNEKENERENKIKNLNYQDLLQAISDMDKNIELILIPRIQLVKMYLEYPVFRRFLFDPIRIQIVMFIENLIENLLEIQQETNKEIVQNILQISEIIIEKIMKLLQL
ncbi:conserved oligomeric golgi complex component 3 [Anaeramoeba flamelloides]|uniref:Conserved oligomeric Golgi complex subunit 3 n=1 Tax=Anaeramoeba flamelloides TaxID=1746091 RepID=A0ABQ8XMJ3_9EUKA|nr:conserved oligomeric golgi complex component 3 [Anaeramoeba flamelloides]